MIIGLLQTELMRSLKPFIVNDIRGEDDRYTTFGWFDTKMTAVPVKCIVEIARAPVVVSQNWRSILMVIRLLVAIIQFCFCFSHVQ